MPGATGARCACRARRLKATFSLWEAQTQQGFVSRRHYSLLFWHRGDSSSVRISGIRSEGELSQGASRWKVGLPQPLWATEHPGWCCWRVGGQGQNSFQWNLHARIHLHSVHHACTWCLWQPAGLGCLCSFIRHHSSWADCFFFLTPVLRASLEFLRLCFCEALLLKLCDTVTEKIRRKKKNRT